MNLDDLLGRLHDEATMRFDDRLTAIERELMRRRLLSAEVSVHLFAQLQELHEEIMRLMPEGEHALDPHRTIRQGLERERRALQRELLLEHKERWRDLQALRREHREVLDQRAAGDDRYRLTSGYD
ncbi:MAG: hypothetical protein SFV54_25025 [Bryobacteraceae bacterium]|nr:hypothetical protein [Bryobacteraceae bacterium]